MLVKLKSIKNNYHILICVGRGNARKRKGMVSVTLISGWWLSPMVTERHRG